MSIDYEGTVKEALQTLETGHLVDRVRSGSLTGEAHSIALGILRSRDVSTNGLPLVPPESGPNETWLEPSAADRLEHAQRRRMLYVFLLVGILPLWCAGVGNASVSYLERGGILNSMVALSVTLLFAIPAIYAVRRFAFDWGSLPKKDANARQIARMWVLFGYSAQALVFFAVIAAILSSLK